MENQNIQWQTWEDPTSNTNDLQEPSTQESNNSWGEVQSPPEPSTQESNNSWGEVQEPLNNLSNPEPQIIPPLTQTNKEFSYLGGVDILKLKNELYYLNFNSETLLSELNNQYSQPLGNDGLYQPQISPNTELEKLAFNISELGKSKGLNLNSLLIKKIRPSESSLNIFKGKPKFNFIVFIQGNYDSGEVVLDLSSMGGPSQKLTDTTTNHLSLIPGWIPYSITKNGSNKELIAIVGNFN